MLLSKNNNELTATVADQQEEERKYI